MRRSKLTGLICFICAAVLAFEYIMGNLNIDLDLLKAMLMPNNITDRINEPVVDIDKILDKPTQDGSTQENAVGGEKVGYDFTKTLTVNDPETFFDCLTQARDNLVSEIHLKFNNYNDDDYDIHKFERGKYSLSSEGKSIGKTAYMTYTFYYSDNFAVSRACEEPLLIPKLSAEQQLTLSKLNAIKNLTVKDGMSDYEKELALHDYIAKNFEYDTPASQQIDIHDEATDITCFLTTHKGVCEAYAYTFKALCELCGMHCYVVTGALDDVKHAWNVIELDGSYYHIDVTSDDPVPDIPQHCFYTYFNLTDDEISKTHILENKWYECTDNRYNYFVYNNFVVNDHSALKALAVERIAQGYDTVLFKKNGFTLTTNDVSKLLSGKGFTSFTITGDLSDPYADHEIRLEN